MRLLLLGIILSLLVPEKEVSNPFFYQEDATYYKYQDPSWECKVDMDKEFLWNFHKAAAPCYQTVDVQIQKEGREISIMQSDGDRSKYIVSESQSVKIVSNRCKDPFFGLEGTLEYMSGLLLVKKEMDATDWWKARDWISYKIKFPAKLEELGFQGYDSLYVEASVNLFAQVEAIDRIFLPFNNRRTHLLSYTKRYNISSLAFEKDGLSTKLDRTKLSLIKSKMGQPEERDWVYLSTEPPYVMNQIRFDNDYNCRSLVFYNDEASNIVPFCDENESNLFLFPNPNFGEFNIMFDHIEPGRYFFAIYNVIGQEILSKEINHEQQDGLYKMSMSELRRGTYLYAIRDTKGNRLQTKKMVVLGI